MLLLPLHLNNEPIFFLFIKKARNTRDNDGVLNSISLLGTYKENNQLQHPLQKAKNNYFILIYPNQDQHHIFMKENVGIKFIK